MAAIEWTFIPRFTHPNFPGVTFGGFLVSRYLASQPNATPDDDNPDVADSADPGDTPAYSRPGVPPWRYITYWNARKAAANANAVDGPGVHLLTAFEWASLALLSHKYGILPHGNNRNTNPPSDVTYTSETALLDRAGNARNSDWHPSLTGTGPVTWNLLHRPEGPADLNGNMWEWVMGLHMQTADEPGHEGHAMVLASYEVSLVRAPYGVSTAVGAGYLTDGHKSWQTDEFLDPNGNVYLIDASGTRHKVKTSSTANDATTIYLEDVGATPVPGPYEIVKDTGVDITAGMTSGNRILSLRTDMPFAIPASSDGTGASEYGNDGYWFNTADAGTAPNNVRTALRGGNWPNGVWAGVFALNLNNSPASSTCSIGFRLGKAI